MKRILYYGEKLRPQLRALIETQVQAKTSMPWEVDFMRRMIPFAASGKLLRGGLLCFAYEMYSSQNADEQVIKAALALELTHSALLIHDDIMDNDRLRRGQPALHWQYQQLGEARHITDSKHFGASLAICGGDALCFMAFGLVSEIYAEPDILREAQHLFAQCLRRTCYGQMQDIFFDAQPELPTKSAIYELMKTKTAAYTIALPLAIGATLAGQKTKVVERLENIGHHAGIVYQIRDDELGILGSEATTGKPLGSDIREGKKTLLYYYLIKYCSTSDRQRIRTIFGNPNLPPDDLRYIRRLVQRQGIAQFLEREVERLTARARIGIRRLHIDEAAATELTDLLTFCAKRQW